MTETISSVEKEDMSIRGEDDDDSDESPEAVSFNQGRQEALESISNALQDLRRTKLKAKERRRERDRLLKEQKQRKKISLSKARLPPALLKKFAEQKDSSSEPREKTQALQQLEAETTSQVKVTNSSGEEDDDDDNEEDEEDEADEYDEENEKYASSIQVIQSSKIVRPPANEAALQFLQNQLYGTRIPRESMAKNVSRRMKRYGKPGMKFCQMRPKGVKKKKKKDSTGILTSH